MTRRPARNQPIPPHEVQLLNSIKGPTLHARVHALYHAGWALQAIGDCLDPKHPRSTVRSWVLRDIDPTKINQEVIDAPIPTPKHKTHPEGYQKKRPAPTEIPQDDLDQIQSLAPLARTYRSRMSRTSAPAVANDRLTAICIRLHANGVGITELAAAANVTYRAMYKRVKL